MKYFALLYEYLAVPDFVERRAPFREEHLRLLRAAHAAGHVVMAGPFDDGPSGALIVFRGDSPEAAGPAEAFVREDPYVAQGLVIRWQVKPWTIVVGA